MKTLGIAVVTVLLASCGNNVTETKDDDKKASEGGTETEAVTGSTEGQPAHKRVSGDYLEGYIVSAFDLSIDNRQFSDAEDFYTQELGRIETEVVDAGYEGYSVRLDAQIGLDSLKQNMKIYVVSTQDQGFATDTKVNESGRFRVSIPAEAVDDTFKIRTNKRVNIILTSPDKKEVVKFCYNLSGHETEATVAADALIDTFSTRITRFACDLSGGGGIEIPSRARPEQSPTDDERGPQ